ncbi:unnamed protein product [Rotaria sp. Silwood2]|nr:unnamed protein product [Rotaria sp. Silwood2]CAF4286746.1 unnamed protein product [Rotaria sp. Silwood2]
MSNIISCSKVIVHRQSSKAYRIQGGTGGKAYISIMFCASATGVLLPPFVINKSKRLFQEWCVKGPPSTGFENSDNGWMNQRLFCRWFEQIFLEHTKNMSRPLLLILDGHDCHFDVETLMLAIKNDVHVSNNHPSIINTVSSPQPIASSFTSSSEAIAALDQILQETISINSSESDDDDVEDDEEYFPFKSTTTSSIATSSTKQKKSQQNKSSAIKHHQSISSKQNKKKKNKSKYHDTIINSSPLDSQESLKAITNALQAVFPTPSKETSNKPAKPTVLDRNYGHIITEKHVIEQLEEQKNKQNSKRSRSTSQKLNGTKRRKK